MSIIDIDKANTAQIVTEYVLQCRSRGTILPYEDYAIISDWIQASPSQDHLILTLSEILPQYFAKLSPGRQPKSLKGLRKKVLKKLSELGNPR